jgi:glutamine---fructose-6-phosphate transaminase (isomerizing)
MNSIESLKLDFHSQIRELNRIRNKKIFDECIYVGSGDSYVAGLIAEFLTDHKCRCYSPSDLSTSRFIEGKTYCFISVTGRTKANIELARRATKSGMRTIAVTFNQNSKLAKVCKEVVPVNITKVHTPTAGFRTFVANVVTCLHIAGIMIPKKFEMWHKKGVELSVKFLNSTVLPAETLYLLGNNILFAIALYTCMQMAEFFGSTAVAYKLEEFCHSPIFGLKKSHYLWVLGQNEEQIIKRLNRLGPRLSYIELYNKDIFAQLFISIFFVQNLILLLAEKYGYTELQYVMMKDVLKASSDIIYGKIN